MKRRYTHQQKQLAHVSNKSAVVLASSRASSLLPLLFLSFCLLHFPFHPPFLCSNFVVFKILGKARDSDRDRDAERVGKRERLIERTFLIIVKSPSWHKCGLGYLLSLRHWEYNIYWCVHMSSDLEQQEVVQYETCSQDWEITKPLYP